MKFKKIILIVVFVCAVFVCGMIYQSNHTLTTSFYQISSEKISKPFCIVQITDLHNSEFGADNEKLIALVEEQSPNLILATGDLLNSDEENVEILLNLLEKLCVIAPTYISYGNHEKDYESNYGVNFKEICKSAGAIVLEKEYQDIVVNGTEIRLGGIFGYCVPEKHLATDEADPEECAFLNEFQNTEKYSILMCHMPVVWIDEGVNEWDVDCVIAGHAHGGEVRIPGLSGVYAPDMGWFPGKLDGVFYSESERNTLVLSRGLGTAGKIPRINNVPEVVVVEFD